MFHIEYKVKVWQYFPKETTLQSANLTRIFRTQVNKGRK